MAEPRSAQVTTNIEQSIYDIFSELATIHQMSISTYSRKLILMHLYEEGLIPEGMLVRILTA